MILAEVWDGEMHSMADPRCYGKIHALFEAVLNGTESSTT